MADSKVSIKDDRTVGLPEEWTVNPMAEIEKSQEQVGMLLEMAYLALKDYPEVAKEVRLSAHTARSQHMMTLGLMKTFVVTATSVLETMIPMMRTTVKIKKSAILQPIFAKVLKLSENMREETKEARQKYLDLQTKIQEDTADVNTGNSRTEKRTKEITVERRLAEEKKRYSEEFFRKLEKDRKSKEKEIEQARKLRVEMMKRSVSVSKEGRQMISSFMKNMMSPRFQDQSIASIPTLIIKGIFGSFAVTFNTLKEIIEMMQARGASTTAHEMVKTASAEKDKLDETISAKKKEALDAQQQIQMLDLETTSLGDLESLMEASSHLANIDEKLLNILSFWDNLSAFIQAMNQKGEVGECFIEAIEIEECAAMFMKELDNMDQCWTHFGVMCSDYARKADLVIPQIFGFLSQPVDSMSIEARKQRSAELLKQIKGTLPAKAFEG